MQINSVDRISRTYAANSAESLNPVVKVDRGGDRVSLSPQGLRAAFMTDLGLEPSTDAITLSDIQRAVERDQASVREMLGTITEELGLTRSSFELSTGLDGGIVVSGNLPERGALQEVLNVNRQFQQIFSRLSANTCLLKAAKDGLEFQQAYAVDPKKAVEDFMSLLDGSQDYSYRFSYAEGRMSSRIVPAYA